MKKNWLTKERHFGSSPLARALGFVLMISVVALAVLSIRDAIFINYYAPQSHYSSNSQSQQSNFDLVNYGETPVLTKEESAPALVQSWQDKQRFANQDEIVGTPRIALHPLSFSQYGQHHKNGAEMSELITSLLMTELGTSNQIDLLDRSLVSVLFDEKSNVMANGQTGSTQSTLEKLPISDFTLVGALFSTDEGKSFSLKLIRNKTGKILGAERFNYTVDTLDESIKKSLVFIKELVINAQSILNAVNNKRIAFGHFIDISNNDSQLNEGRIITERLIEKYVNQAGYAVLSRTQTFPLVFEEYLRLLQYSDEGQVSYRQDVKYLIHGKYRVNFDNKINPLSIYLYIDMISHGRELIVLQAKNWSDAYQKIDSEISEFIPGTGSEPDEGRIKESQDLFLQALRVRGMLYAEKILNGEKPPTNSEIESFASTYKDKNLAPARELIEKSLILNPSNTFSMLAKAMYLKTEGDVETSNNIVNEVLRMQESVSAELAYQLLEDQKNKLKHKVNTQDFAPFLGENGAENIHKALIEQEYLTSYGASSSFNSNRKADQIFNRSHTLSLAGLDDDIAIQVFEKVRAAYYRPGTQVGFATPKRFNSRDSDKKRTWYQNTYNEKHNIEAIVHLDIAKTASNIHINDATTLPSIEFYSEAKSESDARRKSNLEVAVDGFSSSAYLDMDYLKAMIFLGHSLCQKEIGRCASGNMIHSWVVDHTKPENLNGRGGMYFNVSDDVEIKDRLVFLAANAVDRVNDASFSDMFQYSLTNGKYFSNNSKKKLEALLPDNEELVPINDIDKAVYAYANLIRGHCLQLKSDSRQIRYPDEYVGAVEELAEFIDKNKTVYKLGESLLADIETEYPDVYPHVIANAKSLSPFLVNAQDAVVEKVTSGKIVPVKLSEFMEIALNLFEARVASGNIKVAKQYIEKFIDYYAVSDKTAMDFAYLYYRVGDLKKSNSLLNSYGRKSFSLSSYKLPHVNGNYVLKGYTKSFKLKFEHSTNINVYLLYTTAFSRTSGMKFIYGLGEIPVKWELYDRTPLKQSAKKKREFQRYSGNVNPKHQDMFAFGNGGMYIGDRTWTSPVFVKTAAPVATSTGALSSEIIANYIEVDVLNDATLKQPGNSVERLFSEGYNIDTKHGLAIKGYSNKHTVGPLQNSYFSSTFSRKRKINVVKEKLFEKGYLTVAGVPTFDSRDELSRQVDNLFSNYSSSERSNVITALTKAKKIPMAGYVEIHHNNKNTWQLMPTLIAEDAIAGRMFGLATAIHENYALICDAKDGMYSYMRIDGKWVQQQRINSRCSNVIMNSRWAVVSINGFMSKGNILVYKNDNGLWHKTQTLLPDNYLLNMDQGRRYSSFGASLAMTNNTIVVGNPYYGANGYGEVYLFTLSNNEWKQSEIFLPKTTASGFGLSVSANDNMIVVGDPTAGDSNTPMYNSGSVHVYTRKNSRWNLNAYLVPKGRIKNARFGGRVFIKDGEQTSILIKSHKETFRYDLL